MWTGVKSFASLLGAKVLMPRAILLIDSYHVAPHAAAFEWNILFFLLMISMRRWTPELPKVRFVLSSLRSREAARDLMKPSAENFGQMEIRA
jgi:hypothetical protein